MRSTDTKRSPVLGCIADDVTGATDLAINLVNGGMRVVQLLGLPTDSVQTHLSGYDAVVVALKSRSLPAAAARDQSLQSLDWLRSMGVSRFYFKYCSTFDSTIRGNIGPVAEALMQALGIEQTIYCPAFPRAGRTVYQGHLFVGEQLLSDSGMATHPLNPMTDANLVRFLSKQVQGKVGLVDCHTINQGPSAIHKRMDQLRKESVANVITDACDKDQLSKLAEAFAPMKLITGGSGLAAYLPRVYRHEEIVPIEPTEPELPNVAGRSLILAGSCSQATNAQVSTASEHFPTWQVDVAALITDRDKLIAEVLEWANGIDSSRPLLISSSAPPEVVAKYQAEFGEEQVASAIEKFFGAIARQLTEDLSIRRLVIAGGETAGAVVNSLGVRALRIGPEICTGVPWTETIGTEPRLALALKSGNFGDAEFFANALEGLA